jgi:hypothetical protein
MKKITLLFITLSIFVCSYATGGYAIMRVIDCTRGAAMGKEFLDPQILITYETGESEVIELATYSEKEEPENLKIVVSTLNTMRQKGYTLVGTSTTGTQGNLVSEYVFLKP